MIVSCIRLTVALTWNLEDLVPPSEKYIFAFNAKEELKRWHLYSDSEYGGLSSASLEIKDTGNGSCGLSRCLEEAYFRNSMLGGRTWFMRVSRMLLGRSVFNSSDVPVNIIVLKGFSLAISLRMYQRVLSGKSIAAAFVECGRKSFIVVIGALFDELTWGRSFFRSPLNGFVDLDAYDTIALKLKGDGRCYISTIYTENWVNSPGQQEDNLWQAYVFAPKDNWYTTKASALNPIPSHV
ncbi:hypothetical protein GIB67_011949 [Kingdonia uniflora]|uniref:NADH:ubiquinone oxidoreductase intermediate-associated protein 30 domain-containing protein n=1 Tax=Kingdonia uniflora TaxID=39325 RepID=A0A7J7M045_9MAGN|nr:hypothetical protein GIB67_011949 [Kingdonia uniflora]